ncbi:Retrovirus-related Pol polyprotein from transposon TNT 1-94 [Cucumis melo var. makuwa]|uniref:Retrovirus-related Pol polyprotein from transposon TNT 1-94 n=1 Tax=Cucumis melo var. makuwa TaxID=1194695 RepID=A0A5A7V2Y1_CUCMM|nr:Retrovirus-related Pol polyprotein from transposon TNT 1-94 [Cucumis melo var. makuwa]
MTVANNIKSTIKNTEDAKEFMKSVEKCSQSESADKSLAGTLMSTLTNIKFDGSRTIHEHILEMTNLAASMLIQEEARLEKPIIHIANLMGHKGAGKKPGKKNGKGNHGELRFIENDIISGSLEPQKVEIQEVRVEIASSITSSQVIVPVVVDSVDNPQEQQINGQTPHNDIITHEPSEFDLSIDNDPVSFSQAIKGDNSTKRLHAMKEELKSMNDNEVWELVELPKESYTQKDGIDYKETFSPFSKKDSLRIIMALVAHYDLELHQMDVKIAFLNGNLHEEVFMDQPEGRYQSNPGMDHWKAAKKVLRYLQGTKDYLLTYKRSGHLEMIGYSDSDFVGCVDTRKSTFGYLFLLAEGAISWKSAKQSIIAASTMEAEFVACFEATVHGLWLWNFISGLGIVDSIAKSQRIYCDNFAAVFFSKNDKYSVGAKHMELKYFAVKEEVQKQRVSIEHISTKLMIADPLTKGLPPKTFNDHVQRMGINRYHH